MSSIAFDYWRTNYNSLGVKEHSDIYDLSYSKDPTHASFSGRAVRVFLNQTGGNPHVAEIGGRNGALAKVALESTPTIKKWTNYEICGAAVCADIVNDSRYETKLMTDFKWWRQEKIEGDILIMSHFIEHISDEDLTFLISLIPSNIIGVHVQSPIAMQGPNNWKGFNGAHILSMGWLEVNNEFVKNSFRSIKAYDGASWIRIKK